ncbi:MAG TPA: hypothetical protein VNL77_16405 [Roseiflexaceae bacterium]|nr:hypothetical protein [Roseiflexaceae bacterium]
MFRQLTHSTAVILERRDAGTGAGGEALVELVLDVLPASRPPFRASVRATVSGVQSAQLQPGMQLLVQFDPGDPGAVALAGFGASAER